MAARTYCILSVVSRHIIILISTVYNHVLCVSVMSNKLLPYHIKRNVNDGYNDHCEIDNCYVCNR